MRKLFFVIGALFFCALPTAAQTTLATGTVKDVNGIPYAGASIKAGLVFSGTPTSNPTVTVSVLATCRANGFGSAPCQVPFNPSNGPFALDNTGSIPGGGINLQDNSLISPAGTQWQFTINSAGNPPPIGTGPQTCTATITITGASQSISSSFAACPALSNAGGTPANSPLPAATSGPGPVFNVKNYGAFGDTQASDNCTASLFNLNCTDATFTSADVGKRVSCAAGFSTFQVATAKISVFVNATNVTMDTSNSGSGTCIWGHPDDAAVTAAVTAALAQMNSKNGAGPLPAITSAPTVYFPAGAYNFFNTCIAVAPAAGRSGFGILGDGPDQTKLFWNTGSTNGCGAAVTSTGNVRNFRVENLTMDGANGQHSFSNAALFFGGSNVNIVRNVIVERFNSVGVQVAGGIYINNLNSVGNNGQAFICASCNGEAYESVLSNSGNANGANGANLVIQNVTGLNGGPGFRWINGLIDECGTSTTGCTQVTNSQDVWFIGGSFFGTTGGPAIQVDGTSFLHMTGGIAGSFGNDNTVTGLKVLAGGVTQASDVRFVGTGSGKCVNNAGSLFDNGGSTCESQFSIASGTSTGTTAVLTLNLLLVNVNTNCSVGDALVVEGANIPGYNGYYPAGTTSGITAVTATTLTYTTAGSNLGALGAGGTAYCRNLQTYSGTLPKALLNNPIPNTCYITGAFAATTTALPMCNFFLGSATNITHVTASSTTSTTCASAPVVTITDGTATITLTLTSGKGKWDSAVDASTGVNTTIFKPNGTITVSNTAGTCATPPTNFSVSYNIAPILSN